MKSSLQNFVDQYMLTLLLWRLFLDKSTSGKSTSNIHQVFNAHEPHQQHYPWVLNAHHINPNNNSIHLLRSLSTNPSCAFLIWISHSCFTVFGNFRTPPKNKNIFTHNLFPIYFTGDYPYQNYTCSHVLHLCHRCVKLVWSKETCATHVYYM